MGAFLLCRLADTTPGHAKTVNEWLTEQPEHEALATLSRDNSFRFWDEDDIQWAIEEIGQPAVESGNTDKTAEEIGEEYKERGVVRIKTSGIQHDELEQCAELWTSLFEKLHEKFEIEVYSKSCSLHPNYFTKRQVATITNNGDALTGKYDTLDQLYNDIGFN